VLCGQLICRPWSQYPPLANATYSFEILADHSRVPDAMAHVKE
jgi:hypothetical protein